jgi:hypothetical protein
MYWKLYPTLLFSFILWPSPFWGQAHQGIQFLVSAAHGYGSWEVGAAMAWQRQTRFFAGRAWHRHAHSSMPRSLLCSRNHSWAGIQMGPLQSRRQIDILGCCEGPNRAQTTVKSPSQVPEKNLSDAFTLYFKLECFWGVLNMNHTSINGCISCR